MTNTGPNVWVSCVSDRESYSWSTTDRRSLPLTPEPPVSAEISDGSGYGVSLHQPSFFTLWSFTIPLSVPSRVSPLFLGDTSSSLNRLEPYPEPSALLNLTPYIPLLSSVEVLGPAPSLPQGPGTCRAYRTDPLLHGRLRCDSDRPSCGTSTDAVESDRFGYAIVLV